MAADEPVKTPAKMIAIACQGGGTHAAFTWGVLGEILKTKKADLSDDDYEHMRKVVGYCKRHLAQRPDGDITDTKWRYSLMNWGHDPKKK